MLNPETQNTTQLYAVRYSFGDSNINRTADSDLDYASAQELCHTEQQNLGPNYSIWIEEQI